VGSIATGAHCFLNRLPPVVTGSSSMLTGNAMQFATLLPALMCWSACCGRVAVELGETDGTDPIPPMDELEMRRQCPFKQKGGSPDGVLELARSSTPPENRLCCKSSNFFSCRSFSLKKNSKVIYSDPSDPEIGEGWKGKVKEIRPPKAKVTFRHDSIKGVRTATVSFSLLRTVNDEHLDDDEEYYCSCDRCELDEYVDVYDYRVVRNEHKRSLAVTAALNPKGLGGWSTMFPGGHKYVLFLNPGDDHNTAFGMHKLLCHRYKCWMDRGFQVVSRIISSIDEASKVLSTFPDRSIHHVSLGGHGRSYMLRFASGEYLRVDVKQTRNFLVEVLEPKLDLRATVMLDSCSSAEERLSAWWGTSGGNLLEYVARHLYGRSVIGASTGLSDDMWKASADGNCLTADTATFVEDGKDYTAKISTDPKCSYLLPTDLEEFSRDARPFCMSACRETCSEAVEAFEKKHGTYLQMRDFTTEKEEALDGEGCALGHRRLCRVRWEAD